VWVTEKWMKDFPGKKGDALYLWGLTLHTTPSTGAKHLILLTHHAILDGDSILMWLQELVTTMAGRVPFRDSLLS
jgi:hypothetical protein